MPPSKIRFVTLCQQLLVFGVVLVALAPAASVVSLDVVRETPDGEYASISTGERQALELSAYTREAARATAVPTEVVEPTVTEVSLTPPSHATSTQRAAVRRSVAASRDEAVTSVPEPVHGYGAVGVTWEPGADVAEEEIRIAVRTRTGEEWSGWTEVHYDADHGPDPGGPEARRARPGTDALLVGEVDDVQVRVSSADGLPADLRLAVVDPGEADQTARETPELDPGATDAPAATQRSARGVEDAPEDGDIALQAAVYTPKPKIFSRAQWGADERLRDKGSLRYFEVHAGFVHHTVNANDYTRAQVPALLRGIYAYHTKSRGWSDVGYNYLVDRFGRIWEGRAGGIDRPVVGAHTLGYNDYSFAMSAIGNFDVKKPSKAMVQAYGALFGWKLSLHGVDASSGSQRVGSRSFRAISGHRDAGSTACPGRYLYAKLGRIRTLASEVQAGWAGRELESDLAGAAYPDLIVRRASDNQLFVLPTGGLTAFAPKQTAAKGIAGDATATAISDVTGDGRGDLLVIAADGTAQVRPGTAAGRFKAPNPRVIKNLAGHDLVTSVGDLDGDGRGDLVARAANGRLHAFLGKVDGRFAKRQLSIDASGYQLLVGAGDTDGDGRADLIGRDAAGALWLHRGDGKGGFGNRIAVAGKWKRYATITGIGDLNGDGHPDLLARTKNAKGWIVTGRGDGTYGHRLGPIERLRGNGRLLGAVQLLGNKAPEIVVRKGKWVSVFANEGTTELRPPIATGIKAGGADLLLNAGDWDRDGHGDIIIRKRSNGALLLRRGDGKGGFGKATRIATGFKNVKLLAAVGDMTGDGYPDLMGQPRNGAMRIYPGKGLDGLKASYVARSRIDAGRHVGIGRWDGDGAPDSLLRKGKTLRVYPGNGPGGLRSPRALKLNLKPYDWVIGISDIRLSGRPDLIVRAKATGRLWLLTSEGDGFAKRRLLGEGMEDYDLAG